MAPGEYKVKDGKVMTWSYTFTYGTTCTEPSGPVYHRPVGIADIEDIPPKRPPSWGDLNLSGGLPRPLLPLKSRLIVNPMIRWMAKALIGGSAASGSTAA